MNRPAFIKPAICLCLKSSFSKTNNKTKIKIKEFLLENKCDLGPILKEILDRISLKVECLLSMKGKNNANSSACDFALSEMHTIRGLKYYAYSGVFIHIF